MKLKDEVVRHKLVLLSFVLIFLVFLPVSIQAPELAGPQINSVGESSASTVNSFTSVADDMIFIVSSDSSLLTPEFRSWVSFFTFELESNLSIADYIKRPAYARNLFTEATRVLKGHLVGLQRAVLGYNISYHIASDYSYDLLLNFTNVAFSTNATYAYSTLVSSLENSTVHYLQRIAFAAHFATEVAQWGDSLLQYARDNYSNQTISDLTALLNSDIQQFINLLGNFFSDSIQDIFSSVLIKYGIGNRTSPDIYPFIGSMLKGNPTADDINFLRTVFGNADLTVPLKIADENLISFIKGEFIPMNFDIEILNFLRQSFSNYQDGDLKSLVISIPLIHEISTEDVSDLFTKVKEVRDDWSKVSPIPVTINILNQMFYVEERNSTFIENFVLLDYLSIIFSLLILLIFFRSVKISVFPVIIAWSTTYLTRALVVLLLKPFGLISSGSLSVSSALIFGASLNYTVFFLVRYLEEVGNGRDRREALRIAKQFSLHSIHISGIAVVLTSLSLIFSTLRIISNLATAVVTGIIIQLIFLSFLLPAIFELFVEKLGNIPIKKHLIRLPHVSQNWAWKVILLFSILLIISISFLYTQPGEITGNDLIGGNGEVVHAYNTLDKEFPDTFFSKVLISVDINVKLRDENRNLLLKNSDYLTKLFTKLSVVDGVKAVYSYMSPLGKIIDYTNNSYGLIEFSTIRSVAEQFVNRVGNSTFILVQLLTAKTLEQRRIASEIGLITDRIKSMYSEIKTIHLSGLPVIIKTEVNDLFQRTPILILVSIILLTLFLYSRLYSVAIPLRLIFSIIVGGMLSMAFGMLVWLIFFGQPMSLIVISLILIFLLALGTDFDIYLYNRVVEEYEKCKDIKEAINRALDSSAVGIELSGFVMAISFAVLLFSDTSLFVQFGFVISLAILLDISVIRQWLVPALLLAFPENTSRGLDKHLSKFNKGP